MTVFHKDYLLQKHERRQENLMLIVLKRNHVTMIGGVRLDRRYQGCRTSEEVEISLLHGDQFPCRLTIQILTTMINR